MAISLLAYVAIFLDRFFFGKATSSHFFRVIFFKVTQELLFRSSSFFRAAVFFLRSSFLRTVIFSKHFFFFQNTYFFRAKLLPSNHILRIGNSLVQFRNSYFRRYLQKSYFFEADSSAQHQLFQKSKILRKATFSENQYFALPAFSGELPF